MRDAAGRPLPRGGAARTLRSTGGDRRPRRGATVDLLLLAGIFVTGLVTIVAALWVVPMLAIAALAASSDDA